MKSRRVLFVDHAGVMGGAELSLLDLAIAYRQTSRVLLFADGPFRERLEAAGIEVQVAPAPTAVLNIRTSGGLEALKTLPALWWMAGRIAKAATGLEIVHANSQKAFIAAALATWRGSPPVVWHLRDILTAKHFSSLNRRVGVTLANARAAGVIANSQATKEAFSAAGGKRKLVQVVYNGFYSEPFDRVTPEQVREIRISLGIGNAPLVGVFSRLSYWKGQHLLLKAIKELPGVHALLVGEALFGEEEYVSQLKSQAAISQLAGRIHWLGFRDDIPALMSACDIVAHTSTEPEPFGRVIVEGQLAKRPVVASAAGGAMELIQDGVTGRLFPSGDAQALAGIIRELLAKPEEAITLGQQAYTSAQTNFSLETIIASFDRALSAIYIKLR